MGKQTVTPGLRKLWAIPHKDSPFIGATLINFAYETTVDGNPWLADVDVEHMFAPHTFEIDPDPCGAGFRDADGMRAHLARREAFEVGWVDADTGGLHITRNIQIETGWGDPRGNLVLEPTSYDVIPANADPEVVIE